MSAAALRWAAAALLAICGFCAGDARRQKLARRRRTLEQTIALLTKLRQEIAYRRTDLGQLYRTLAAEYSPGDSLGRAMKKAECFAGMQIGRAHV